MRNRKDRTYNFRDAGAVLLVSVLAIFLPVTSPQLTAQTSMSADGIIESSSGGFMFPDGSVQESAVATALTPIDSVPFTINAPGSYYLTRSLTLDAGIGISIAASDVTLDLMGHTLDGLGSAQDGILVTGVHKNIDIRNGTLARFSNIGVDAFDADFVRVTRVRAIDNGSVGLRLQGNGSEVTGCTARGNGDRGIAMGGEGIVRGSVSRANLAGITSSGLGAAFLQNFVEGNTNNGIRCQSECTILDNTVRGNNQSDSVGFAGIRVDNHDSVVRGNHVTGNLQQNILVAGSGNLIESNLITNSSIGVHFDITAGDNATANNRWSNHSTADFQNNGIGTIAALDNLAF